MPAEAETPPGKRKTLLKTKYLFGYDAHLIVTRDAEHDVVLLDDGTPNPEVLPTLFLGVALDKPGQCPAYNGLQILNRLGERGYQPGHPAGDRAYNNSEPDEWQLPIRAMGYKPVYDYRADQRGKQAETDGAILVEGRWYCPSMPEPLINATIDPNPSPAGPLKVCRQRTVTISPETGAKHWQSLEYGGPEWHVSRLTQPRATPAPLAEQPAAECRYDDDLD
ncbi:hypothetical protein [Streptomyces mirabilis]|uniref:hypothetical protein n=1 Tax=Streptomyces mirabilis TaxID=68239 RepID=UPI003332A4CF